MGLLGVDEARLGYEQLHAWTLNHLRLQGINTSLARSAKYGGFQPISLQ